MNCFNSILFFISLQILKKFTCLDGNKEISFDQINDNYCDCEDGSDEVGTSACSNGQFFCKNLLYRPSTIPSSRVNDGICDCCDGSDEMIQGKTENNNCENVCAQFGQVLWEEQKIHLDKLVKGVQERNRLVKEVLIAKDKALGELSGLEGELTKVKSELEKLEADKLEKSKVVDEIKDKRSDEAKEKQARELFGVLDKNQNEIIELEEEIFEQHSELNEKKESIIQSFLPTEEERSEESKEIAKSISVKWDEFYSKIFPLISDTIQFEISEKETKVEDEEGQIDQVDEMDLGDQSPESPESPDDFHEDDDHQEIDDGDIEPVKEVEIPKKQYEKLKDIPPTFREDEQKLINEMEELTKVVNEKSSKVHEIEENIKKSEEIHDEKFGKEGEYYHLNEKCFDFKERQYTYRVCFFKEADQIEGGSSTPIGYFSKWIGENEQLYDNGRTCWNGPPRSTRVVLSCATENVILSVKEPQRCEYEIKFSTPAACHPNLLQEHHDEIKKTSEYNFDKHEEL
ncbi:hypothetical protein SNEBB_005342 [Seison nebaliae]|nr:hypothetical protein SNEBB_005342 [Seison nebaliae]